MLSINLRSQRSTQCKVRPRVWCCGTWKRQRRLFTVEYIKLCRPNLFISGDCCLATCSNKTLKLIFYFGEIWQKSSWLQTKAIVVKYEWTTPMENFTFVFSGRILRCSFQSRKSCLWFSAGLLGPRNFYPKTALFVKAKGISRCGLGKRILKFYLWIKKRCGEELRDPRFAIYFLRCFLIKYYVT